MLGGDLRLAPPREDWVGVTCERDAKTAGSREEIDQGMRQEVRPSLEASVQSDRGPCCMGGRSNPRSTVGLSDHSILALRRLVMVNSWFVTEKDRIWRSIHNGMINRMDSVVPIIQPGPRMRPAEQAGGECAILVFGNAQVQQRLWRLPG